MHDERMRELIPSIVDCISNFTVPIMNTMYSIQCDLYQHLYASFYEYATAQGLSKTDDLVEECLALYEPIRQKVEWEVKSLREGKTARIPMGESTGKSVLFSRKPSMPPTRPTTKTSVASPPPYAPQVESSRNNHKVPPAGPATVSLPTKPSYGAGSRATSSSSLNSEAAKKKPPPPPPPPKPSVSPKPEFVTAIYDFAGESQGDLAFKVGDRIKVIKKTNSLDDWWEGELNGSRGMFPRNYCQ